jgi:hypothetical protein
LKYFATIAKKCKAPTVVNSMDMKNTPGSLTPFSPINKMCRSSFSCTGDDARVRVFMTRLTTLNYFHPAYQHNSPATSMVPVNCVGGIWPVIGILEKNAVLFGPNSDQNGLEQILPFAGDE